MSNPGSTPRKKRLTDGFLKGSGLGAWITYLGVRSIFAVMQAFPLENSLESARIIAKIWKRVMPRHRRHAITHLQKAFGDQIAQVEMEKIADTCLESVIMFAIELVCLPRLRILKAGGHPMRPPLYFGVYLDMPPITLVIAKAQRMLKIKATPFADGLKETYRWYLKNYKSPKTDFSFEDSLLG